jgi:two-component system sensor histidine kinase ChvG
MWWKAFSLKRFGRRRLPSLGTRILLVNLVALLGLFIGILYLDSFRERLLAFRQAELLSQGQMIAGMLSPGAEGWPEARTKLESLSLAGGTRVRLFDSSGRLLADNWRNPAVNRFSLEDPTTAGFRRQSARAIDRLVDTISRTADLPPWNDEDADRTGIWPFAEGQGADRTALHASNARVARTEERAIVVEAAVPVRLQGIDEVGALVLTAGTGELVEAVRQERAEAFRLLLVLVIASLLLSFYLARTIVRPLGELALAAQRVRRGRAREISIPRYPDRRDEIGRLARALADMTESLRHRIDETGAFAADVSHELRNPLASLRSAVEALGSVRQAADRDRLFELIHQDVQRIDRLIQDISAASRMEAELSRTVAEPIDLGVLVPAMADALRETATWRDRVRLAVEAPARGMAIVLAAEGRLEQVIVNLLDNAASFSPPGGEVRVLVEPTAEEVVLRVTDDGPGVAPEVRDAIFTRFWSDRPQAEGFGQHSGLGLSIVRAIVEAFDGSVRAIDRPDGAKGGCLEVRLPLVAARASDRLVPVDP